MMWKRVKYHIDICFFYHPIIFTLLLTMFIIIVMIAVVSNIPFLTD